MDPELVAIGDRIKSRLPLGMTQVRLAEKAGMTPDALSRALNAKRGFSTRELTQIGKVLGANLHWLLTGTEEPHALSIAARHEWNHYTRTRTNPGRGEDDTLLSGLREAYVAAFPGGATSSLDVPGEAGIVRSLLGPGFVRNFADRVEFLLGIDIIRIPKLSTDYSLVLGKKNVIALAAQPNWYRSNWSLAHEIGHLALSHHDSASSSAALVDRFESAANAFAAELLLPEKHIREIDWRAIDKEALAHFVWEMGVSTKALATRLRVLGIQVSQLVEEVLRGPTTTFLRRGAGGGSLGIDLIQIARREQESAGRRFPDTLVAALTEKVEAGAASPETLAWVLNVDVDSIDFPDRSDEEAADDYTSRMANRPGIEFWSDWLAGQTRAS